MMQHKDKSAADQTQTQRRLPQNVSETRPEPAACSAEAIEKQEEALLDEAIELTFPASDPISVPSYNEAFEKSKWRKDCATQPPH